MERRLFLKNLAAIAAVAHIPIIETKADKKAYGLEIKTEKEIVFFDVKNIELNVWKEPDEEFRTWEQPDKVFTIPNTGRKGWDLKVWTHPESRECKICINSFHYGDILALKFKVGKRYYEGSGFINAIYLTSQEFEVAISGSGQLIKI